MFVSLFRVQGWCRKHSGVLAVHVTRKPSGGVLGAGSLCRITFKRLAKNASDKAVVKTNTETYHGKEVDTVTPIIVTSYTVRYSTEPVHAHAVPPSVGCGRSLCSDCLLPL